MALLIRIAIGYEKMNHNIGNVRPICIFFIKSIVPSDAKNIQNKNVRGPKLIESGLFKYAITFLMIYIDTSKKAAAPAI